MPAEGSTTGDDFVRIDSILLDHSQKVSMVRTHSRTLSCISIALFNRITRKDARHLSNKSLEPISHPHFPVNSSTKILRMVVVCCLIMNTWHWLEWQLSKDFDLWLDNIDLIATLTNINLGPYISNTMILSHSRWMGWKREQIYMKKFPFEILKFLGHEFFSLTVKTAIMNINKYLILHRFKPTNIMLLRFRYVILVPVSHYR